MPFTIIPWQVDVPQERLPLANWLIIAIIVGFFAWQIEQVHTYHTSITDELNHTAVKQTHSSFKIKTDLFQGLVLNGWTVKGLLGNMWLHAGWMHLIGNLFFLWIFGNAVDAKIGHIKFVPAYIILGVAAGTSHLYFSGGPAVGASGAIYGVMGMYLVFFPLNSISCLFVMLFPYYVKTFEVSSYAIILMRIVFDISGALIGGGHIAYFAHLGGFAAGVAMATLLLQTRLVKMSPYEKSIFQIFSASRTKHQTKEKLYAHRVLMRDYAISDKKQEAEESREVVSVESSMQSQAPLNDGFIRFYCGCGKRCKIPVQFAGKTGKCPQCKQPIKIPSL